MSASRDHGDRTQRVELPSEEVGPVPVAISRVEPRWFGVAPPVLLLGLAAATFAGALALFATSHWPYALILLGVSALLTAAFLEVARRRPDSRLALYAAGSVAAAREQAAAAVERLLARSSAAADVRRVRSAKALIDTGRRAALLQLGEAVHRGDEAGGAQARLRLAELEAKETELSARLAERLASTEERIRRSRLSVQQTMVVKPDPEPYPPPDEGTPPTPAPIPEPSPDPGPDESSRRPAA